MNQAARQFSRRSFWAVVLVAMVALPLAAAAQPDAQVHIAAQKAAMQKLAFLAGKWQGPITVQRGAMEPLHMTQTENVQWKLDRLVLEIEGTATSAEGKTMFRALATVSYDDVAKEYHIRAYHEGQYLDAELTVKDGGFTWGFPAGPVHVENAMHLTPKGEWYETTEFSMGSAPPRRSMEMTLEHQP